MKARYCSASARIEIRVMSTFWLRASDRSRSSGPSKPSTSTTSAGSSSPRVERPRRSPRSRSWSRGRVTGGPSRSGSPTASRLAPASARNSSRAACAIERLRLPCATASARAAALARLAGKQRRRVGDRAHLLDPPVAVKHDIAAGVIDRLPPVAIIPRKCIHRNVIADQQAVETDSSADDIADHGRARWSPDASGSIGAEDDVAGHRHRQVGECRRTARNPSPPASSRSASTTGRIVVAVDGRAALPGNVLDHRQDAAGDAARRPRRGRAAATRRGSPPKERSPIASLAPGSDDVEHRRAVDGDADIAEIGGDQPAMQPGGALALFRSSSAETAEDPRRRIVRPVRAAAAAARGRPPGRSAPAHRRGRPRRGKPSIEVADLRRGSPQLRLKRIRPERLLDGEEDRSSPVKSRSGAAGYEGLDRHRPSRRSRRAAISASGRGCSRRRPP